MSTPLLLSVFPTFAVGGAQSRFTTLANHLGPGWRHAIVAMDGVTAARERLRDAVDVVFPASVTRKGDLIGNVRRIRAFVRTLEPSVMLTHNFGSIEWAIANRRPIVRHLHVEDGFGPEERHVQLPRRVWLRRMFLKACPVVLPSRTLMTIARTAWRLRDTQLHYVPNGVDLARFTAGLPTRTWPGEGPLVGTVAALRPEKNVARLIRAFSAAQNVGPARLVIIGDGAERGALEELAASLGVAERVFFEGHLSNPDAALRSLDIFAMSSDTEQMPISLLEAMAAGLPVAATNVGDVSAMLATENRRFAMACNDEALTNALRALLVDRPLRLALGRENRSKAVQDFDQADMFARWAALLAGRPLRSCESVS